MERYLGKRIRNDLHNAYGVTVIPAGSILSEEHLELIRKQRINPLDIVLGDDAEAGGERSCGEKVQHAIERSKELFDEYRLSHKIPLADIRKDIVPAVQEIARTPDIFTLFQAIRGTDDYTYQHNIGVGVLATLIGRWMQMDEAELSLLSLAATMHDIGKLKVPTELLSKPGKLTADEYEQIKKHTVYGYEILKDTVGANSRMALAALQHHEREDGNGYPLGLTGDRIDPFSKIVAVADIFHAMSSKRPYRDQLPFHNIVDQMRRGSFGVLDPQVVSVFLENIVKRSVGREVVLTDGRVGEIVYLNPHNIETPLVRVEEEYIDLSKTRDIAIKEIGI